MNNHGKKRRIVWQADTCSGYHAGKQFADGLAVVGHTTDCQQATQQIVSTRATSITEPYSTSFLSMDCSAAIALIAARSAQPVGLLHVDQTWLGVRRHTAGEFKPLLFSHNWTTQGQNQPDNCPCFTEIWPKMYITHVRFWFDFDKSSVLNVFRPPSSFEIYQYI